MPRVRRERLSATAGGSDSEWFILFAPMRPPGGHHATSPVVALAPEPRCKRRGDAGRGMCHMSSCVSVGSNQHCIISNSMPAAGGNTRPEIGANSSCCMQGADRKSTRALIRLIRLPHLPNRAKVIRPLVRAISCCADHDFRLGCQEHRSRMFGPWLAHGGHGTSIA